jgi:hypothetical protein
MHASFVRKPFTAITAPAVAALLSAALLCAAPPAARADDTVASNAGVGVARIALIRGQVAVQRGDSATATTAVINAPVLGADYVTTGDDSRAEVQFDATSAVRLGANVQMRFTRLDANDRELQLAEGTIDLRLLRGADGRSQIDTPSISIRPRTSGSYRITVDNGGATRVTVRSGSADVITPQGAEVLAPGTTLLARGAAANPSVQRLDAVAYDDFDRFNADRDVPEMRALADANAPPGVAGIDDLNAYGRWVSDTGYGNVWTPAYVAPGWAPYRDGRWAWEDSYGWTWIGYEPWGWAPYHYGRWYHSPRYGWCWYPARAVVPWSPAIVSFITFGGIGFGFNSIGWVPLAPFEPFNPWWGNGSTVVVNNTYVTNNYVINHRRDDNRVLARPFYQNARFGGGTEISKQRFLEGRFDHPRTVAPGRMRDWQVVRGAVPVIPSDANLRFSDRPVARPLVLRTTALQGTFAGDAVAPQRTPIAQQRAALTSVPRAEHPAVVRDVHPEAQAPAAQRNAITVNNGDATPKRIIDPWARFGANRGAPAGHPVTVIDGAAATSAATGTAHANAATGTAPGNAATGTAAAGTGTSTTAAGAGHPQATRGNGTTSLPRSTQDGGVWKRFDNSAAGRPAAAHEPVTVHDGSAMRDPVRTQQQPHRTFDTPANGAPANLNAAPAYTAPRQQPQYSAPVYAAPRQQPQYSAPAPAAQPRYEPARPAPAHANPPPQAQHAERSTSTQHH